MSTSFMKPTSGKDSDEIVAGTVRTHSEMVLAEASVEVHVPVEASGEGEMKSMAGLLTRFRPAPPSHPPYGQWLDVAWTIAKLTAAGTVADSHRFPSRAL